MSSIIIIVKLPEALNYWEAKGVANMASELLCNQK